MTRTRSTRRLAAALVISTLVGLTASTTVSAETTTTTAAAGAGNGSCAATTAATTASTTAAGAASTAASAPVTTPAAGAATTPAAPAKVAGELDGSGATFPKVFYQEMIAAFGDANPDATITYAGGGSGKGRQDLADQVVQWAGTDGVIKDADKASYKGGEVLYFPTVVAPITVAYHLDADTVKLSPATIARIFQREVTNWNDPAITADNGGTALADQAITVVHRSDSSGTTGNFTRFLEASVGAGHDCVWKLGTDSTVEWSADTQAGEGNSGVAQIVASTPGAIGYVDLADATDAKLKFAEVQNKAGTFVAADLAGASAAAAGATLADDLTFSAVWADGDAAYPITAQTWIVVYKVQPDKTVGETLKSFLHYLLTDGQQAAAELGFAPLPAAIADKALAQLEQLQIG